MMLRLTSHLTVAALVMSLWTTSSHAASITNYQTYKATTATTLAGNGTDDPVVGSAAAPASTAFVIGHLATPAVLGGNVGDFVKLSFGVSFTDAVGIVNSGDNFRFALFDTNSETAPDTIAGGPNYATAGTDNTDNFRGYIIGVRNGTGTGSGGSIRERIAMLASGDNAFAVSSPNTVTAPSLGAIGGSPVTLASDGTTYEGVLTLTRTALGVDVSGSFIGSNATTGNTFSVSDNTVPTSSTFGAIGFLIGGPLNVDQVSFRNVRVNVPEPASAMLMLIAAVGFAVRRANRVRNAGTKS